MKYRQDPDLDFLKQCTSRELDILVKVLLFNKDGQPRSIVQLPNHPLYKEHAPNHAAYWEVVAGEIQRYGSNPLAALARAGRGSITSKFWTMFAAGSPCTISRTHPWRSWSGRCA